MGYCIHCSQQKELQVKFKGLEVLRNTTSQLVKYYANFCCKSPLPCMSALYYSKHFVHPCRSETKSWRYYCCLLDC